MPGSNTCPECGAVLPAGAPHGLCPKCLLAGEVAPIAGGGEFKTMVVAAPSGFEKPGDRIGRYKLLQKLGEGGCGIVYMAEQEEPVKRRVALKIIKLGMDTKEVIARFEAERQALALMDHPNIAKVLDGGATSIGRPFFVMELVRGVPITRFSDENRLNTTQRLELFILACQAIQHAHQKGIIHRDIKPSNILVADHDGIPVPKVIDFGIAKATAGQTLTDKTLFTAFDQFIGTPAYMSPEQAKLSGLDIDTRSDIYSLGVLLYELLTGKTPFDAKRLIQAGLDEIRRIIREEEPPRPSTRLSTLDAADQTAVAQQRKTELPKLAGLVRGDLDWIVMKTLEKDRSRRYETANGLAMDLKRFLGNEPVLARPPSSLYRFQKSVRRHKAAFAATIAAVLALLLGLGLSTWSFIQERVARKEARTEATKSQQIAHFLEKMLRGVDPSIAQGMDSTLLQRILDQTITDIPRDLKGQPEVEAELRYTIGEVYWLLGIFDKAEVMFRAALVLRKNLPGMDPADTATLLDDLGSALREQSKLKEAEEYVRQGLGLRRAVLGPENVAVASSLNNLGLLLELQGKFPESESVHREALAMRRKLIGQEHVDVVNSLHNLGLVLRDENKVAEAESVDREALAMRRKLLGDEHPDVSASLCGLSSLLWAEGNLPEAEKLQKEALMHQRKVLGDEHPYVANSMNNLATILWNEGNAAEAESLTRESLVLLRKRLGNDHTRIAYSLSNLGYMLWRKGDLKGAEENNRDALAMRRRLEGENHPDVAQSLENLGMVLRDENKLSEAEDMLQQSLAVRRKVLPSGHPDIASSLDDLVLVQLDKSHFEAAEPLAREALDIREKIAPDDWRTFNTRCRLGRSLLGQKKYADAESLLVSSYKGMWQRWDKIPADKKPRIKDAVEALVQLYDAWGKPDKAAEWRTRLTETEWRASGK